MALYFIIMMLSGYMGMPVSKLPKVLKYISDLLPTTQLGNEYINFGWERTIILAPLYIQYFF